MQKKIRKIPKEKKLYKICDELWYELIKLIYNYTCQKCGSKHIPQAHHIFDRTYWPIRYNKENGICLCLKCHSFWAHARGKELEYSQWILTVRKKEDLDKLEMRKYSQGKLDLKMIEIYLRHEIKTLRGE